MGVAEFSFDHAFGNLRLAQARANDESSISFATIAWILRNGQTHLDFSQSIFDSSRTHQVGTALQNRQR